MEDRKLRIMAIGAHPDDCEYCFGGTAAKYISLGHAVCFVSATNGSAGHQTMSREKLAAVRVDEAAQAGSLSGVTYIILDHDDCNLTADLKTRDELIGIIRKFKPDLIFTHRTNDYHTDHRHTGMLVQDSSYLLGVPLVCPEVPCLRYMPAIFSFYDEFKKPLPIQIDVVVEIDDTIIQKVRMLDCHKSQFYDWLPWIEHETDQLPAAEEQRFCWLEKKIQDKDAAAANFCRRQLRMKYGAGRGEIIRFAEAFEMSEYGRVLTADEISACFPF